VPAALYRPEFSDVESAISCWAGYYYFGHVPVDSHLGEGRRTESSLDIVALFFGKAGRWQWVLCLRAGDSIVAYPGLFSVCRGPL